MDGSVGATQGVLNGFEVSVTRVKTPKISFKKGGRTVKLILAVVEDDDAARLMDALIENDFSATKLASTGGFLLRGNTTLLIGVEDQRVDQVLEIVKQTCVRRKRLVPQTSTEIPASMSLPIEVESGGATVFVLSVDQFKKI